MVDQRPCANASGGRLFEPKVLWCGVSIIHGSPRKAREALPEGLPETRVGTRLKIINDI